MQSNDSHCTIVHSLRNCYASNSCIVIHITVRCLPACRQPPRAARTPTRSMCERTRAARGGPCGTPRAAARAATPAVGRSAGGRARCACSARTARATSSSCRSSNAAAAVVKSAAEPELRPGTERLSGAGISLANLRPRRAREWTSSAKRVRTTGVGRRSRRSVCPVAGPELASHGPGSVRDHESGVRPESRVP